MAVHERFSFSDIDALLKKAETLGVEIPVAERTDILGTSVSFGDLTVPNRLCIHPMEGCDGEPDGSPSPLVTRRYERFAAGGAGLLWLEACAVVPEGRANPRQLWLHAGNVERFAALVDRIHAAAREAMGDAFRPVLVLQLTHSGRYSKPTGTPAPMIAHHSIIDSASHVDPDLPVVTDAYLDELQAAYVQSATLAQQVGFDAVDIKACHRYLVSELLASFTREHSRYGGSYENRTRFLRETVQRVREAVPGMEVTSRLNLYDALEAPYGWGVSGDDARVSDMTEPLRLIGDLASLGYHGLNTTIGNPYYNPHVNRPFDAPIKGGYTPPEHPLEGFGRFLQITRTAQEAYPDMTMIGSGYAWVRHFFPQIAAGVLERGWAKMIGLGRGAFAYPTFARDILTTGRMNPKQVCITCSGCTQMMRDGVQAGCMVRDADVYGPIYRDGRQRAKG